MTYEEIIQSAGKQITPIITNSEKTVELDNFVEAKLSFSSTLVGTVMKSLELELREKLTKSPINVTLKAKLGTNEATKSYNGYYIKDVKYNADTRTYTHECYDYLLTSMIDYDGVDVEFPMTVYEYFNAVCDRLGYVNNIATLPNGNLMVANDVFENIGYTYRDVLDDIGTANGVLFEMENREIKIASISQNTITIDDDILKNANVEYGEHYGAINVISLSRAGGSDSIYYPSDLPRDICEFRIVDNQLMNDNDRVDYLEALYNQLSGIEYDVFDNELVGYGGFKPLQKIKFETGGNEYRSYVLNNEITIKQGYKESIYAELQEESETDFKTASTTDKMMRKTYIIVDKVNGEIQQVVSEIGDRSERQTTIQQDIESIEARLNQTISVIDEKTGNGHVLLNDLANTKIVYLSVSPMGEYDIKTLAVDDGIVANVDFYVGTPTIIFKGDKTYRYQLPTLYYYNGVYDEFIVDNVNQEVYIIHRIGFNDDGSKKILKKDVKEVLEKDSNSFIIGEGDNRIYLAGYDGGYDTTYSKNRYAKINAKAMIKNDLTTQFATEVYVDNHIKIERDNIDIAVNRKLEGVADDEGNVTSASMILAINEDEQSEVKIEANKLKLEGYTTINEGFSIDLEGNMTCNNATINGDVVTQNGVLTNLIYFGEMWGWAKENVYEGTQAGFVGWNYGDGEVTSIHKSFLNFSIKIPPNFTIVSAKIYLKGTPVLWTSPSGEEMQGGCSWINLYKVEGLGNKGYASYLSECDIGGDAPIFNEILLQQKLSFSVEQMEEKETIDLKNYLNNGSGTYNICAMTSYPITKIPPIEHAYALMGQTTGILTGYCEVKGYTKFE